MLIALLVASLAAAPDAGVAAGSPAGEAARLLERNLRSGFAHCSGLSVQPKPVLQLSLPSPCRFAGGRTAAGVLRFELFALNAADAPVRERAQRLRITAAPFTLDRLQFDGVLLEARLTEDGRGMTLLPRRQALKTRALAPEPGERWVEAAPSRDRRYDPIGDAARDVVSFAAAAPSVVDGLGKELARLIHEGALQSAPELVALWALAAAAEVLDGGSTQR